MMAKKFKKFNTVLSEDGYRRIKEVRDNILRVKLPAIREEIASTTDNGILPYLEKEKKKLLYYVLQQNQYLHFSHVIPSSDKPREVSVRKEVQWFSEQMETKLRENDHKGGWDECSIDWLYSRLQEESRELWRAVDRDDFDAADIAREAADVANFAMMIADKARNHLS